MHDKLAKSTHKSKQASKQAKQRIIKSRKPTHQLTPASQPTSQPANKLIFLRRKKVVIIQGHIYAPSAISSITVVIIMWTLIKDLVKTMTDVCWGSWEREIPVCVARVDFIENVRPSLIFNSGESTKVREWKSHKVAITVCYSEIRREVLRKSIKSKGMWVSGPRATMFV